MRLLAGTRSDRALALAEHLALVEMRHEDGLDILPPGLGIAQRLDHRPPRKIFDRDVVVFVEGREPDPDDGDAAHKGLLQIAW